MSIAGCTPNTTSSAAVVNLLIIHRAALDHHLRRFPTRRKYWSDPNGGISGSAVIYQSRQRKNWSEQGPATRIGVASQSNGGIEVIRVRTCSSNRRRMLLNATWESKSSQVIILAKRASFGKSVGRPSLREHLQRGYSDPGGCGCGMLHGRASFSPMPLNPNRPPCRFYLRA